MFINVEEGNGSSYLKNDFVWIRYVAWAFHKLFLNNEILIIQSINYTSACHSTFSLQGHLTNTTASL